MKQLDGKTRELLWIDPDVREVCLRRLVTRADGRSAAPANGRPRGCQLLPGPAGHGAGCGGEGDRLSRHQRGEESAARFAAGTMHGPRGRRRSLGRDGADGAVARGLSVEDAPAARRASDQLRSAAHGGRGNHLRRLRHSRRPLGVAPDSRASVADVSRAGLWAAWAFGKRPASRRRAGLRHDPEAHGRHHARRGRQSGRRGRPMPAVHVRQGG